MGSWNFGSPSITEGVKIVAECTCDDSTDECFCYEDEKSTIEVIKEELSNIHISYGRLIADNIAINIDLNTPLVDTIHGYYNGVALDYSLDSEISMYLTDKEGNEITLDSEEDYLKLEEELSHCDGWYYEDIAYNLYNDGSNLEMTLEELESADSGALLFMLVQHSNAILPYSTTVGWATGTYEAEVASITDYSLKDSEAITAYSLIK